MGRVVQPGGKSGKICVRYTARRKYGLLTAAQHMRVVGKSLQGVAAELKVCALLLSRWEVQKVGKMDPRDKLFKSKKKANVAGLISQLEVIKEPLLHYVFEMRERGIVVNTFTVTLRVSYLLPEICEKSFTTRCSAVKHWLVAHLMRYQMGTHTLQRAPAKVESEALNHMAYMRRIVLSSNRDRCFILNMDQTPVYFLMSAKCTLEVIEKKTIHICTSTDDTKRATVVVTIAADGTLLPSMVVFKGQPKGRIVRTEFSSYPTMNMYRCQANAWMDKAVMVV
jgi:hypothetical protein